MDGRQQSLAGLRSDAPQPDTSDTAQQVWRVPEGWRAWLRRPWAVAGRASRRRTKRRTSNTSAAGVEGAGGTGGHGRLRDRPLRAFRLACGDLAGGRALRRPEHQRRNKQQHAARMARGADVSRAGRRPRAHQAARPSRAHQATRPQPGYATKSSPSEPCARAGASRQGQSGCAPRCAAPRLRYR